MSRKWQAKVGSIIKTQQVSNLLSSPAANHFEEEEEEEEIQQDVSRRFCFESQEDKRIRRNRKQGLQEQLAEVEVDINEVAEKDDDDIAASVSMMVAFVLNSVYFKGMIFVVIGINAFHIALQTVETIAIPYSYIFFFVDNLIMGIFICEIVLKWYSGFVIFWKDYWNLLDFIVIFVLHLGPWLAFFSNTRLLRILRVIRAFRSLKTVTSLTGLSLVVETIMQSVTDMANIMMLLIIFMVVLSVVGVKLFGKYVPEYFGDPIKCMFSIFVCFTQDGWMQIFRNFERYAEEDKFTYISACCFFILTILMAAFIIANLIVAVVTTNLDRAMKEMKEEQRSKRDTLPLESKQDKQNKKLEIEGEEDEVPDVGLVHISEVLENGTMGGGGVNVDALKPQRPLYKCDVSHITTEKLEDYFLLLIALDENLKAHQEIRDVLSGVLRQIRGLNDTAGGDAEAARLLIGQRKSASLYDDLSRTTIRSRMEQDDEERKE
nr:cation channel sperm-associated protein 4-like [Ciona intestinalis]|eukprot:XP_002120692.1 cation channel sperm-associated protein 4-like [Ciona intestinalis]